MISKLIFCMNQGDTFDCGVMDEDKPSARGFIRVRHGKEMHLEVQIPLNDGVAEVLEQLAHMIRSKSSLIVPAARIPQMPPTGGGPTRGN